MSEEPAKYYAGPEPEPTGRVAIITESEVRANPGQRQLTLYSARLVPQEDLKNAIARAICRSDNRLASCSHCLTQLCKEKQEEECKRILSKEKELDASYMVRAEAVLQAILNMEPPAKKTLDK